MLDRHRGGGQTDEVEVLCFSGLANKTCNKEKVGSLHSLSCYGPIARLNANSLFERMFRKSVSNPVYSIRKYCCRCMHIYAHSFNRIDRILFYVASLYRCPHHISHFSEKSWVYSPVCRCRDGASSSRPVVRLAQSPEIPQRH